MAEDKANKGLFIRALCGVGGVYNFVGRYKDALQAHKKAEVLVSDRRSKIEILMGQASIYENLSEYNSMISVLRPLGFMKLGLARTRWLICSIRNPQTESSATA